MSYKSIRRSLCILMSFIIAFSFSACGETKENQKQIKAMNTVLTLTAYGKDTDAALNAAEATVLAVDSLSDVDLYTSTCNMLNTAQGDVVNVSGQIAEMLIDAQEIYKRSGGAYDITSYPLSDLWGFTDGRYYIPTDAEISESMARLCMDQLTISNFKMSGTYAVQLPSYGQLSFQTCAKGCAAKYAVDAMRKNGVQSGIVSMEGFVETLGMKPDGTPWSVGIPDPNAPSTYLGVISVGEMALSTTGAYQQYMPSNPEYHYILSMKTGYPVTNNLQSLTVLCEDGTYADCLSHAMYALGQSSALSYWRNYGGFEMIMITKSGEIICTAGLLEQFDLRNSNYTLSYVE